MEKTKQPVIEAHLVQLELRLKEAGQLCNLASELIKEEQGGIILRVRLCDLMGDVKESLKRSEEIRKNFKQWNK